MKRDADLRVVVHSVRQGQVRADLFGDARSDGTTKVVLNDRSSLFPSAWDEYARHHVRRPEQFVRAEHVRASATIATTTTARVSKTQPVSKCHNVALLKRYDICCGDRQLTPSLKYEVGHKPLRAL